MDNNGGKNGGRIEELIRVTEERTRVEERVRTLLQEISGGQAGITSDMRSLAAQVETLGRCVGGLQQMIVVVVEYMAVLAGRDQDEIREIRDGLLASIRAGGVQFGPGANVGIGGDMVGQDKKGGE